MTTTINNIQEGKRIWFWLPNFNPRTNKTTYTFQTGYCVAINEKLEAEILFDSSTGKTKWISNEFIICIFNH